MPLTGATIILMSSQKVEVHLQIDPAGVLESPARPYPLLVVHYGVPVEIGCERGGQGHRGLSIHGYIDIVPAGTPSYWRLHKQDSALVVRLSSDLVRDAAADIGIPASEAILLNRFQIRDPKLEHLAWALKADMDAGFGSGSLYTESIGAAMACQLLGDHSAAASVIRSAQPGVMLAFRLRRVVAFIEDNLSADISLADIATASGLSVSHCQRAFRAAMGISLHQYVIRRAWNRHAHSSARHVSPSRKSRTPSVFPTRAISPLTCAVFLGFPRRCCAGQ